MPLPIAVRDEGNSTNTPLDAFGVFPGRFIDVTNYAAITIAINSDVGAQYPGIEVQWSNDGVTVLQSQLFEFNGPYFTGTGFTDGVTFHLPVRMRFYRVVYTNDYQPQGFFVLAASLLQVPATGTVQRVAPNQRFFNNTLEGQVSLSILACQDYFNQQFVLPYATTDNVPLGGAYLIVDKPIASETIRTVVRTSSLSDQLIDAGFGQTIRRFASVYNDSIRGNLFLRLETGVPASLTDYHWKVPPRHTWNLPQAWGLSSADLHGIWDIADGRSVYTEGGA